MQALVIKKCWVTVQELEDEEGWTVWFGLSMLSEHLVMWKMFAKCVPQQLMMEEKQDTQDWTNNDPDYLNTLIMEMSCRFMHMVQKPRCSSYNGEISYPWGAHKKAMSKPCWLFHLTSVWWWIKSGTTKPKHNQSAILRSFVTFIMLCDAKQLDTWATRT